MENGGVKPAYDTNLKNNIKSIEKLLSFVNVIAELKVLGGEPLLYPHLKELLEFLSGQEKIKKVIIATNGTIVPSDDIMKILKSNKFIVAVSFYGKYSRHINELREKTLSYGIKYIEYFADGTPWVDVGGIECRNRTTDEIKKQFENCTIGCKSLFNGKLHFCARSSNLMDLDVIKECDCYNDYVDLLDENLSDSIIKEKLKRVFFGKYPPFACNYCNHGTEDAKPIVPGEQVEGE